MKRRDDHMSHVADLNQSLSRISGLLEKERFGMRKGQVSPCRPGQSAQGSPQALGAGQARGKYGSRKRTIVEVLRSAYPDRLTLAEIQEAAFRRHGVVLIRQTIACSLSRLKKNGDVSLADHGWAWSGER